MSSGSLVWQWEEGQEVSADRICLVYLIILGRRMQCGAAGRAPLAQTCET